MAYCTAGHVSRSLVGSPASSRLGLERCWRIQVHVAFSTDAHKGLRGVGEIAHAMVNNPFWDFWRD